MRPGFFREPRRLRRISSSQRYPCEKKSFYELCIVMMVLKHSCIVIET